MKRVLYAWEGENRIGVFEESESGDVSFSYDSGAAYPISLSMPFHDEWNPRAPFLFLDGLLPDDANERYVMMNSLGAASIHPFDLLDSVDAAGGLCFTQVDEPPTEESPVLQPMNEADIEAEIQRISSRRVMGWEVQPGSKFSLAGTQGKFTLVKYGEGWYRPYVGLASTHIIKPSIRTLEGSASVECACMDIASLCGVEAPWHGMITAGSQDAYIVERFDRRMREDGSADRLRTEDMTQALALSRDEKYDVECGDVAALLMRTDPSGELAYQWFKQVAFNAFIGNGDAHGKNYSLVLDKGDVRLSPIYDVVNTVMWHQFGEGLAMPVNGKYYASELAPSDWAAEANAAGLDGNKVAEAACDISRGILMHLDEAVAMLSPSLRDAMRDSVFKANKGMQ